MMFLFAVPVFEVFSIFILPEMLGARDLPFPRLSAYGFWSFVLGGIFVCGSIFFDAAPRGGWFMYPPLWSNVVLYWHFSAITVVITVAVIAGFPLVA